MPKSATTPPQIPAFFSNETLDYVVYKVDDLKIQSEEDASQLSPPVTTCHYRLETDTAAATAPLEMLHSPPGGRTLSHFGIGGKA